MKKIYTLALLLGIIQSANTQSKHLWATTSTGGAHGWGTILESDSVGNGFHTVYSFDYTNGSFGVGRMAKGNDGKLYGVTLRGGFGNSCVLYSYDPSNGNYVKLYDYEAHLAGGAIPYAGVILAGNGKFYGMCNQGGANGYGTLYSYDPSSSLYVDLHDFADATGSSPYGELVEATNGKLYGMASNGGTGFVSPGVVFSFNPANNSYNVEHYFTGTDGANPAYSNLIQATNGKIYGTTAGGGSHGLGLIFSYDPVTTQYDTLHNFGGEPFGNDTFGSVAGGLVQANNGKLYGITSSTPGSASFLGYGEIYSYDISTNVFQAVVLLDSIKGYGAQRTLTKISNGKLIGTNKYGGLYGYGTIFSFDPANNAYAKLIDLDSTSTGSFPTSDILETGATVTQIQELNEIPVVIYPNPSHNRLFIETGEMIADEINIYETTGRLIAHAKQSADKSIDISQLAAGTYMVEIKTKQTVIRKKCIKI